MKRRVPNFVPQLVWQYTVRTNSLATPTRCAQFSRHLEMCEILNTIYISNIQGINSQALWKKVSDSHLFYVRSAFHGSHVIQAIGWLALIHKQVMEPKQSILVQQLKQQHQQQYLKCCNFKHDIIMITACWSIADKQA